MLEFHEANVFILLPAVFFFNFFKIFFQSSTNDVLKVENKDLTPTQAFVPSLSLWDLRLWDLSKWTRSASLPSVSAPFVSRLTPVNLWFITQNSYCIWCWSQGRKQTLTLTPRSLQFAPYLAHRHACVVILASPLDLSYRKHISLFYLFILQPFEMVWIVYSVSPRKMLASVTGRQITYRLAGKNFFLVSNFFHKPLFNR